MSGIATPRVCRRIWTPARGQDVLSPRVYAKALAAKLEAFKREAKPRKALHLTMITTEGVARNAHYDIVQREVIIDDLFV